MNLAEHRKPSHSSFDTPVGEKTHPACLFRHRAGLITSRIHPYWLTKEEARECMTSERGDTRMHPTRPQLLKRVRSVVLMTMGNEGNPENPLNDAGDPTLSRKANTLC